MNAFASFAQLNVLDGLRQYARSFSEGGYRLWAVAIEILLISCVVYAMVRFLHGTRGARLGKALALILVVSFLVVRLAAQSLQLERIIFLYSYFVVGVFLVTLVVFQPELRRGLLRIGEGRWFPPWAKDAELTIDPVITAVSRLSKKQIGALIAIQRGVGVAALVESGVRVDSAVTAELLETIFWPGSALHDMGVIIREGRIAAASCQFPLAESGDVDRALGSRHRAAIGLSHDSDALVIVVSEETGTISVAERGRLRRGLHPDELRALLQVRLRAIPRDDRETDDEAPDEAIVSPPDGRLASDDPAPQPAATPAPTERVETKQASNV